jgi:hypothetical protein
MNSLDVLLNNTVGQFWRRLGRALNALTGRSSVSIAKCLTLVAVAIYSGTLTIRTMVDVGVLYGVCVMLPASLGIFWLIFGRGAWQQIRLVEREAQVHTDVMGPAHAKALESAGVMTVVGIFLPVIPFRNLTFLAAMAAGILLLGGALYIATDHRGSKESLPKRDWTRLKSRASGLLPGRNPLPTPS